MREVLKRLVGEWQFHRVLTGIPSSGTVEGIARFLALSDSLLQYTEEGKLTMAVGTFDVKRGYRWDIEAEKIYFEDGRLFHALKFESETEATAGHLCVCDQYEGRYRFFADQFEIDYTVSGPEKNYTSQTVFMRKK